MSEAHDAVWDALQSEPRPITSERALSVAVAATAAAGQSEAQFRSWFETNGPALLEKLNAA